MLLENQAWAGEMVAREPDYFLRHMQGQSPEVLWIGCADSRVPAEFITNSPAGSLFVHRNIANLAMTSDLSFMSVLEYAVIGLGIRHVVVCGHHGCGGVQAAMVPGRKELAHVNRHLVDIRQTWQVHQDELAAIADPAERANRLAAANVIAQIRHLSGNPIIQQAWEQGELVLHGWIYDLSSGHLINLARVDQASHEASRQR